ncbi:MAG: hypothetical protein A2087_13820 [Spirochaetes bacterium GWD1_61_31]|nr:MAG: hypothetical protein A2Y37_10345 [Spirochaetes bacterium GWB1_60_80]OHD33757.1 MAG: hypothetical protein A2004_09615 [Spirochaetes bacterium GWC1_61_12]OHD38981.1 MAG: hypothetical protein A2087_13820 [Spirochaetes bacterium GWD1_61_31]OHD43431.1 MAG: hypothetical protein A2Y35_11715 [Spirochaetes bacterium GWE1_60_18]OHD58962.1 MAG: hypothetical protein A2Y32_10505 [Spirochaetes bacterium GWF1_60_12]HAP42643.1 hypothetical protein [Spirochaetaceae bacterium]
MSIRDFLKMLSGHGVVTALVLVAVPLASLVWGLLHRRVRSGQAPWKYGYSALVYLACIPGMLSAVLVAYSVFFTRENLLDADFLTYFLPLLTMAASLLLIRRRVAFAELPGFGRLSGLMILLAVSFALALAIDKTRIFLGFFGSIDRLFILVGVIFVLLKTSLYLTFGKGKARSNLPVRD